MDSIVFHIKTIVLPLLAISVAIVILYLFVSAFLYNQNIPYRKNIQHTLENFLVAVLIENTEPHYYQERLQKLKHELPLHKNWCKNLTIATLIQYKKNIRGKYAERIPELFEDLNLHQYTLQRLQSFFINTQCEALYDLQMIGYRKKIKKILVPFLRHKRKVIRSSAYMAYFTLYPVVKGDFKNTTVIINELNLIKIMDILHQNRVTINPNAGRWLASNNDSIKKIAIKTLVFYNDKSHDAAIITLLDSKEDSLVLEVIYALRDLFIFEGELPLLQRFFKFSIPLQIQALKTLKVIGSASTVSFLSTHFDQLMLPELQLNAMETLVYVNEQEAQRLAQENSVRHTMYEHIKTKRDYGY